MPRLGSRAAAVLLATASVAALLAVFAGDLASVIDRRFVETAKAVLATAAVAVLWVGVRAAPGGRLRRGCEMLLIVLAAASAIAWWNFMRFHYDHFTHYSDTFHYYVGSKYFDELGYTRLYACVAVADAEAGLSTGVFDRDLRDLVTNRMQSARTVLADPSACKKHFSLDRWQGFAHDVGWFRSRVPIARWHVIQRDHGYNPPPSWGMVGGWLANRAPASDAQMRWILGIDSVLLAALWASIAWGFGWRVLCVAMVYWGTNLFGDFGWNGGSFLRQSWLATAIVGIVLLRKEKHAAAGLLLTLSAGLRIFPAAIVLGVVLRAGWDLFRQPRGGLGRERVRFALGCGAAVALLALSVPSQGPGAWAAFVENSATHLATPLKNHMGLRTVLAHDATNVDRMVTEGTPIERYEAWADARTDAFAGREVAYWAALALFGALLVFAVRDQPDWVAAVLAMGLIPIAFELTNYYYSILLAYGLLFARWPAIGIGLCAVAAASWLSVELWMWQDEILTWCSLQVVLFAFFCTAWPLFRPAREGASGAPHPDPASRS